MSAHEACALERAFHRAASWFDSDVAPVAAPAGLDRHAALREMARLCGLRVRRVRLRQGKRLPRMVLPMVAFCADGLHPLAFLPSDRERPDGNVLDSEAFLLYRRLPATARGKEILAHALRGCALEIVAATLVGGLAALAGAAVSLALAWKRPLWAAAAIAGWALLEALTRVAAVRTEGKVKVALIPAGWDRILRTAVPFFRANRPEEISWAAEGIPLVAQALAIRLAALPGSLLLAAANAIVLWMLMPTAAWSAAVVLGAILAVRTAALINELKAAEAWECANRRNGSFLWQYLRNVPALRLMGALDRQSERYLADAKVNTGAKGRNHRRAALREALAASMPLLALAVVAWHARNAAFLAALLQLVAAMELIMEHVGVLLRYRFAQQRLKRVWSADLDREVPGGRNRRIQGGIHVDHLRFRYPGTGHPALDDVSLTVAPGEFIGLAGPSGSGKSTLLRLLFGLDLPDGGSVAYDGTPLTALDLETVRSQIEAVLQDEVLGEGTIRSHIVGMSPHGLEDAWEAARVACLADEIRALPMGMQTFAHDGVLSTGQKQRLLIARALARRPAILILDEALGSLDDELQDRVLANLRRVPGLTCLITSHRPSALAMMDRVYVFDRGCVVRVDAGQPRYMPQELPQSAPPPPKLFREEALARFYAAEPLDRPLRLAGDRFF